MRPVILLLITSIIGLACGPKVTESPAVDDGKIRLSGRVVYIDSQAIGAPEVWVIYGIVAADSSDSTRLDSVMTDRQGEFLIEGAEPGGLFWELYREPRRDCYGGNGLLTATNDLTNLKWRYEHRPSCENFWPPDTTDSM